MMIHLVGIALNLSLIFGAWWAAQFIFRQRGLGTQILAAATIAWAWCILGMQLLGVLSQLDLRGAMCWVGLGLVSALLCGRYWTFPKLQSPQSQTPSSKELFSWPARICLAFSIWVSLEMALQSALYPVKVMSDGPIYHLYFAVRWWKAGKYLMIAAPFGETAATYFPANGDLWFTWLMVNWGGDRLARIGQAPFLFLAGLAAYQIARTLSASRSSSLIATIWFLTSTPVLVFSFQANVDTIFFANYLAAAYFFLRFARGEDGSASLLLGGLAAGGALGTKSVALVFVPPLILLTSLAVIARPDTPGVRITRILTLFSAPLVLSGFWYIQNWALTGNPVYPLRIELFGKTLLSGWYGRGAMEHSSFYIPVAWWSALGDILLGVLDPRLAPFWIMAISGGWLFFRPRGISETRWVWLLSFLAVANVLLYWFFIPYRTQQRFMLQALGLAVTPLALLFDRSKWIASLATFLLVLHVATPQTWPFVLSDKQSIPWDLNPMIPNFIGPPLSLYTTIVGTTAGAKGSIFGLGLLIPIVMGVLTILVAWSWSHRFSGTRLRTLLIPLGNTALLGIAGFLIYWPWNVSPKLLVYPPFPDFYIGWMNFESATGPNGTKVAYAGTNIPYYLFGAGLKNEVIYVNVDEHRDWLMHDYHLLASSEGKGVWPNSRPGWDRAHPDYSSWLANLEAEQVKLLVVTKVNTSEGLHNVADVEGFPVERQWADSHPERFQLLYGSTERDPWFRIYRLLPSQGFRS